MGRVMAKSKGTEAPKAQGEPTASGAGISRRHGWQRWRTTVVAVVAVGAVFAVSAVIGSYKRAADKHGVSRPTGIAAGSPIFGIPVHPTVPVTIEVYEDLRSPVSKDFAKTYSKALNSLLYSGQVQITYQLVTSSDKQYGGTGSAQAANAAACADDLGKTYFSEFVDELWAHQPTDPSKDLFASSSYLVKLGRKVKGMPASSFEPCVQTRMHQGWVAASQKDYASSGYGDVPVVVINGKEYEATKDGLTPQKLTALAKQAADYAVAHPTASPSATSTS
ncbi:thioredoxin domain-containing protein [Streptantibioticus parmotrematis]|uniref:DsbA family protein n=1 Tax=Streptantibioticus parmotrematis TaxID=2873249 RepID=UPI003402D9D2